MQTITSTNTNGKEITATIGESKTTTKGTWFTAEGLAKATKTPITIEGTTYVLTTYVEDAPTYGHSVEVEGIDPVEVGLIGWTEKGLTTLRTFDKGRTGTGIGILETVCGFLTDLYH